VVSRLATLFAGGSNLNSQEGTSDDLPHYIADLADRSAKHTKSAVDGGATDTTAETIFHTNSGSHTQDVVGVSYTPGASLTSNDTSYATLTVKKRTAAGADGGVVGTIATKTAAGGGSGDWTAFVPVAGTLNTDPTVLELAPGDSLTVSIAKASSGVAVPAGVLIAAWQ